MLWNLRNSGKLSNYRKSRKSRKFKKFKKIKEINTSMNLLTIFIDPAVEFKEF
jgi:hypothetical protein